MQIDVILGELARRDALIVAGDDMSVLLTAYSSATPDPVPLDGDVRLVIFKGSYDANTTVGVGQNPVVFDVSASATSRLSGRWKWRIEQIHNDTRSTLMIGVLVIINPEVR